MKTYSQSKQDLFVLLVNPKPAFFIDIGCSIPEFQSNTKLLLENGWSGFCLDIEHRHEEWKVWPRASFVQGDATTFEWEKRFGKELVAYASIDVDIRTYDALKNFISRGMGFLCATIEHDAYRFGNSMKILQRELMSDAGYLMVRADVSHNGCAYEDWYVHPSVNFDQIKNEVSKWE